MRVQIYVGWCPCVLRFLTFIVGIEFILIILIVKKTMQLTDFLFECDLLLFPCHPQGMIVQWWRVYSSTQLQLVEPLWRPPSVCWMESVKLPSIGQEVGTMPKSKSTQQACFVNLLNNDWVNGLNVPEHISQTTDISHMDVSIYLFKTNEKLKLHSVKSEAHRLNALLLLCYCWKKIEL